MSSRFFYRLIFLFLCCVSFFATMLCAEDVKLREEAVQLVERANRVSLPGSVPNYQQEVTFRVHYPDGSIKEGSYSRVAAGAAGYREEDRFGDYHAITVRSGERISSTASRDFPPEMRELKEQVPVHLGRFDHEDVIRSIEDASIEGLAAKCVRFDTQFGSSLQQNQICVETSKGFVLRWQVGDEIIENSDYFPVGTLWAPAHIVRTLHGALRMEIEQKIMVTEGAVDPNIFTPPSVWNKLIQCRPYRRPIVISAPQPPPGNVGTDIVDVIVTGLVLPNGKTDVLKVQSSSRPELNDEALKTVAQWTFQPMMCNDEPGTQGTDFVVHFQGR